MPSESERDVPCVISCGYRQVLIPKSGLQFPAWKIQVGDGCVVWRTKRDFWRLSRSFPQCGTFKAAWKKLSDASPWVRLEVEYDKDECINNWDSKMTKSLKKVDQFLQNVRRIAEAHGDPESQAALEWQEFSRHHDSDEILGISISLVDENSSAMVGNRLGQYFCSKENSQQLVREFLGRLPSDGPKVVVVEPSCGNGGVVSELLENAQSQASICKIIGVDLDPVNIEHCRSLQATTEQTPVEWKVANFLESKNEESLENASICIIGGPPYSAGAGNGNEGMQRDLPIKFVEHAIHEYHAETVCFLMPARCKKPSYYDWIPSTYKWETIELNAPSYFFFQGRPEDRVIQPSVILCCWKSDGTS